MKQTAELVSSNKFDYILIEASGASEPMSIVQSIAMVVDMSESYDLPSICRLDNVVYELHIKTTPEAWEENYLCASYNAALVCIDRFYEEYADINVKETEQTRYKILKRKIFSVSDKFDDEILDRR